MENDAGDFDCDGTERALMFLLEELSLRRERDDEYEKQASVLLAKQQFLESQLKAEKIRVGTIIAENKKDKSSMKREVEREELLLKEEIAQCEEEVRRMTEQTEAIRESCAIVVKENSQLQKLAAELEQNVGCLSQLESRRASVGFELRKLVQEVRFQVAQLKQEQQEVHRLTKQTRQRNQTILLELEDHVVKVHDLEKENDAMRRSLVEVKAQLAYAQADKRRVTVKSDDGLNEEIEKLREEIAKASHEYLDLLAQIPSGSCKNVKVQTDGQSNSDS